MVTKTNVSQLFGEFAGDASLALWVKSEFTIVVEQYCYLANIRNIESSLINDTFFIDDYLEAISKGYRCISTCASDTRWVKMRSVPTPMKDRLKKFLSELPDFYVVVLHALSHGGMDNSKVTLKYLATEISYLHPGRSRIGLANEHDFHYIQNAMNHLSRRTTKYTLIDDLKLYMNLA